MEVESTNKIKNKNEEYEKNKRLYLFDNDNNAIRCYDFTNSKIWN